VPGSELCLRSDGESWLFTLNGSPYEDKLGNVTIKTSVSNITIKAEQTSIVKKKPVVNFALDGMCSMN
jgi:hypothetical protein